MSAVLWFFHWSDSEQPAVAFNPCQDFIRQARFRWKEEAGYVRKQTRLHVSVKNVKSTWLQLRGNIFPA